MSRTDLIPFQQFVGREYFAYQTWSLRQFENMDSIVHEIITKSDVDVQFITDLFDRSDWVG